nr:hypothetical protein OG781_40770 [Streptomyces sp. NBC_00830]
MLIDNQFRAILDNGRHGPDAIVLAGDPPAPASSPAAPWKSFHVEKHLDVNSPTQNTDQYSFEIREFFRVHPLFVVRAFGHHKRVFPFPDTHCDNVAYDDYRGERDVPYGSAPAEGKGAPGSPAPHEGLHDKSGRRESDTPVAGGAVSALPRDGAAVGGAGPLSAKHIVIAVGGLLMVLGVSALAWLRRRRSAA